MNLQRSVRDRWVFGVCGGIAREAGINPLLVRAAVALFGIIVPGVSTLMVGVVYVVLGFVLPESSEF